MRGGSLAVMVVPLVVGIILIRARLMKQPLKWLIFKIVGWEEMNLRLNITREIGCMLLGHLALLLVIIIMMIPANHVHHESHHVIQSLAHWAVIVDV
ncbi:hypothetical protein B9J09_05585 [Xylella fastidiosa subsp. pauca]|nr:hypothetical protein B9J09_05585 [Xylella fastidiosa subsp. pauca]KXB11541.1 hypothetical protein ADT32_04920 [Xylella fastidiosa]KXB14658.1 hypothetical protein ADT31_09250 [Xylella fastidiosa]KXB15488.1 hypothetical protein ADT33_04645 [Xylella fastidiosa]